MRTLYMNLLGTEKRIALQEDGQLVEIFFERPDEKEIVGNIYIGRVINILPGMQAAFVDIGAKQNAYIHRDDLPGADGKKAISQLVHQGQALLVQVVKDAIDTKGPRLTAKPEFTGKYVVYMPYDDTVAVSRKIQDASRKQELLQLGSNQEGQGGFIFRSAAGTAALDEVKAEITKLRRTYERLVQMNERPPLLVHTAVSLFDRVFQEIPDGTVDCVVVDDRAATTELAAKLGEHKVEFYNGKEHIFDYYQIEAELEKALKKVVWLPGGSYILIEQTETMTVIDVNTGKFTGKQTLEDTVLKTNERAAKEIARQLRLRDIGGMVLIDFINMKEKEAREQVKRTLLSELKKDRTPSRVLGFTGLGILEMTRKRKRKSLRDYVLSSCSCCHGLGMNLAPSAIAYRLQRELFQYRGTDYEAALVAAPKEVQDIFAQLQLGKELPVEVMFQTILSADYSIRHLGTKAEIASRKN
ncbi:MAG: Rne/Rng family ribonuclease [Ectobacillus sp.]